MGCGKWILPGWFNIDMAVSNAPQTHGARPDLLCDFTGPIPLPDGCASELIAIHVWEHVDRWRCDATIEEWKRLLRPDGLLVLEMPDVIKCCKNVIAGRVGKNGVADQLGMWGLYGDPTKEDKLMMHAWGWTFATLAPFLERHGFVGIKEERTQFHISGRKYRDFRVTARKA